MTRFGSTNPILEQALIRQKNGERLNQKMVKAIKEDEEKTAIRKAWLAQRRANLRAWGLL